MRTTVITAAILILVTLAGCIAPIEEIKTDPGRSAQSDTPNRESSTLEYSGTLAAGSCTVSDQVNTCNAPLHSGHVNKSPPPHTVWHEVTIEESIDELRLEADWQWSKPGSATFYVELEWEGDIVAEGDQEDPLIYLNDIPMGSFDPEDDRLWLYFGVRPVEDPAGQHYPRVDVDYTITVQMDGAP